MDKGHIYNFSDFTSQMCILLYYLPLPIWLSYVLKEVLIGFIKFIKYKALLD